MSENGQRSTQSTNTNPTSDTVSSSVPFTLKRWNLVGKEEIFCLFFFRKEIIEILIRYLELGCSS